MLWHIGPTARKIQILSQRGISQWRAQPMSSEGTMALSVMLLRSNKGETAT